VAIIANQLLHCSWHHTSNNLVGSGLNQLESFEINALRRAACSPNLIYLSAASIAFNEVSDCCNSRV
jgi:hypothetical protein